MESRYKLPLKVWIAVIFISIAFFFIIMYLVWIGVSLTDAPTNLIFIIPSIVSIGIFSIFVVAAIYVRIKYAIFIKTHYCVECGATIKLEEKKCSNCGADDIKRKEALEKLEEKEKSIEEKRKRNLMKIREKSSEKKWRTKEQDEDKYLYYGEQMREAKAMKMAISIGGTLEDKKKWVEAQYREGKSFREIAEELGEDMITVRHYLDEDLEKYRR